MKKDGFFHILRQTKGFTLIEVIVSLIVAAIMSVVLVTMVQSTTSKSARIVAVTMNTSYLRTVMENINSDYASMITPQATTSTSILDDLAADINGAVDYLPGYNYTVVSTTRYSSFVTGTSSGTLVLGSVSSNGPIMQVIIRDPDTGMTLSELFFDNS